MSWTEIVFWLFARLRSLLWYYHRLARILEVAVFCLQDEASLNYLADNPHACADFESKLADGEHVLDIVIALRAREILGYPLQPDERPGTGRRARIHHARSIEHLTARLDRLIQRFGDVERLAHLRASRLRRESEAAPVVLMADHRPQDSAPGLWLWLWWLWCFSARHVVSSRAFSPLPAGLRIRAPP